MPMLMTTHLIGLRMAKGGLSFSFHERVPHTSPATKCELTDGLLIFQICPRSKLSAPIYNVRELGAESTMHCHKGWDCKKTWVPLCSFAVLLLFGEDTQANYPWDDFTSSFQQPKILLRRYGEKTPVRSKIKLSSFYYLELYREAVLRYNLITNDTTSFKLLH